MGRLKKRMLKLQKSTMDPWRKFHMPRIISTYHHKATYHHNISMEMYPRPVRLHGAALLRELHAHGAAKETHVEIAEIDHGFMVF
jgi:hypothetical protein